MAIFKEGQAVRVIAITRKMAQPGAWTGVQVGDEGVILCADPEGQFDWVVKVRGRYSHPWDGFPPDAFLLDSCELAPLTDPKADEFIERIKKLKPYDEPRVEPQREHIGSPDWP